MAKFDIKTVKPKFVVTTAPETKIDVSINRPVITAKNQKAYFKLKNTGGPKGEKGDPGTAATITVGSTSTGAPGTSASVTNTGSASAAVLDFVIPKGDKGDTGDTGATGSPGAAATVAVGTTTTGNPGTNASVTNSGTQSAAVLNFAIPRGAKGDAGDSATITVGTTTTGQPGTNASVTNSGTQSAAVLNFTIPRGDKGDQGDPGTPGTPGAAATIAVGTTTTGNPGTNASVTNSGTSSAAVFNFTIPKGAKGDPGDPGTPGTAATIAVGSTQTGNPGTSASVVNSGTSSAAVLDFTIPKGDKGDTGNPGSAATIAVGTVTTGQAGTSASVTNTGTSSAAVLDFTIPRGDTGATGADGYSPTASVSKSGDTATITITDKNGTTTASVTEPTVDSALSWTSQNPVENQTIRNTIYTKNSSGDKEAGINIAFSNPNLNPYVHLGSKTSAIRGNNSVGIGNNAEASAVRSVAIGNAATASKREGVALGPNATAGQYSLSIGYYTNTVPNYSTAVGPYARVLTDATNATAIGYQSEASEAETVSVGNSTNKRRIVNVADGTTATDAATVGQIPTKTSDLTNDGADNTSAYVEADELATVATSGDYDDLTDKPTIGNATLTIQKNGTSAGTFTANATSNKTINITVPTTAADVSALPASTKYGASIAVSINTTDYKVTTTLKDQDGNTLGTAQVIDLPLESVVVNGSYDNTNKKIVLTLQNGNTIDIPVADLVAGLQSEITSSNKLSSDLVDDTNHTHKFVTAAQITKLSGIAAGAEVNVQSDWDQTTTTADDYIKNKPSLATVATSGSYNDLSDKPTIPTNYLPLSGGTMTGDITLKDLNGAIFTTSHTQYYYPSANSVANLPCVRDSYHDRFAFANIVTNETTTDGTTWAPATDTSSLKDLFIQKQNQSIQILSTDILARRFVVNGTQYSQTEWFEFFVTYGGGSAQPFIFKIETSGDNATWTTRFETTFSSIMAGAYCHTGIVSGGVDTYYRFTFTKTGSVTNRRMDLAFLRGFTRRRGNQGLGIEQELPYDWDATKNLFPLTNNSMTLGTSSRKWSNVYATTFTGALSGNASTATKATQDGSGNTITTTYATKSELSAKADTSSLSAVATSGAYSDLSGKPTIPTAGTITSGSTGYATGGDVYNAIGDVESILSTLNIGGGAQ